MPTLKWIGKDKVINHHLDVPYRVLEKKYTYNSDTSSENKIIHGDNLEVLKSLLPEYEGRINCIYIDPPYNTGEEKWIYNDNVNDPKIKQWLGKVVGKESEDLTRHDKWLCMMYPRIKLLHRLLADDGVIFISIDDNEQANLKLLCDEIFGKNNFVVNFPWRKRTAKSDVPYGISQDYESIVCYAKSISFSAGVEGGNRKYYETEDFKGRPWRFHDLTKQTTAEERPNSFFTIINPKNNEEFPANPLRTWAITKDTFDKYYSENRIIFPNDYDFLNIAKPVLRYWKEDDEKKAGESFGLVSVSTNLPKEVGMTQDGTKEITNIFGTKKFNFPKPSSLIQFLLKISTDKNSIILDSFAGSGTTAHSVLNLNKSDEGNRKFIIVEMGDYAENLTAERVKKVISGYFYEGANKTLLFSKKITLNILKKGESIYSEIDTIKKEKGYLYAEIKVAIEDNCINVYGIRNKNINIEGTGGNFSYYELGQPMFLENEYLNEELPLPEIHRYVWYTETNQPYNQSVTEQTKYLLGVNEDTAYYFYYEKDSLTTLNYDFLKMIKNKSGVYIIYADNCSLSKEFLNRNNIIFKKIPRDISRF